MSAIKALAAKAAALLRDMSSNVSVIYAEKGMEPFKKPLLISLTVMLSVYYFIYSPVQGRMAARTAELEKWRLIESHFSEYESASAKISAYRDRLPPLKQKEEWLSNLINSTALQHGMAVDSLLPQTEKEVGNYLLVSREASLTTTYAQFGKWLADIEKNPAFVRVSAVSVKKVEDPFLYVRVSVKLATVYRTDSEAAGPA